MTGQVAPGNEPQAEHWQNAGPIWEALQDQMDARFAEHGVAVIDAAVAKPGERVLDVGCGTGASSLELAARVSPGGEVVGIDISPAMVEAAGQRAAGTRATNASFLVVDAQQEQVESSTFDLVFSQFGVMFFSDPVVAFANLRGGLRSGGRLAFVCWQSAEENPWMTRPMEAVRRHLDVPPGGAPRFSLADPERIRSILSEAGYGEIAIEDSRRPTFLGPTLDSAVEDTYQLSPATSGLDEREPELASAVRSSIADALREYEGPAGVQTESAAWVVTANATR